MINHRAPENPDAGYNSKGRQFKSELKTIFQYLWEHTATASMVSHATGVPQKNICRYKRDLEKEGRLWETEKKLCKHTGYKAWYLTTNPNVRLSIKRIMEHDEADTVRVTTEIREERKHLAKEGKQLWQRI